MASTYVNDLRLNEMATGDASGTWGTVTNTNLELIGEALGFGTEAITTNADTHTSTVADGATDPARAMYIKYTGTLDSACTITIAPNTLNRMHFIENGTSGSQNIIISQGSGANVTIPPGDTKAVYLDGAGSGAAVVDAFASLNVVDLKVEDDLTVTDDASVGGALTVTGASILNGGIDVAGDFTFDIGGGDLTFKDDGTSVASFGLELGNFIVNAPTSDTDIIFKGNDGGSAITALTLDMSAAGDATFNNNVTVASMFVAANITHAGDNDTQISFTDNEITLDSGGDIVLDADGADIKLADNGTVFGELTNASSYLRIKNPIQDQDIEFVGNDGGSNVTALRLDMSSAGDAIFNQDIFVRNIYGASDGNTGIQWEGSDVLTFHTGGAENIQLTSNAIVFNQDSADMDLRIESNNNTAMFFVDAGNDRIGVGTDSPSHLLDVDGGSAVARLRVSSTGTGAREAGIILANSSKSSDNDGIVISHGSAATTFDDLGGNELIRIAQSSNKPKVGIGTNNPNSELHVEGASNPVSFIRQTSTADDAGVIYRHDRSTGGQQGRHLSFTQTNGTEVGSISAHGSATFFNTSSDYRLKDNISYSFDATSRLKQLKPCQFNFKTNTDTTVDGFLAHEVSSVVPEAINGEKDATRDIGTIKDAENNLIKEDAYEHEKKENQTWTKTGTENIYQSIDQSKLIPLLTKTILELEARITALEGA